MSEQAPQTPRIPLTLLPLEARHLTTTPVPYRAAWLAAVEGRIPAERADNGRWSVARDDLPRIVATLCPSAPISAVAA